MAEPLGVFVAGANGRMGKNIIKLVVADPEARLVGASERSDSEVQGADAGLNAGVHVTSITISSDLERYLQKSSGVIIDFSNPQTTLKNIERAVASKTPIVIGTTGFTDEERSLIQEYAKSIAIVQDPNMSVGMNLVFKMIDQAARVLNEDYDIEVIEAHHRNKVDSPSGTAVKIAKILCEATGRNVEEDLVYKRHGMGKRTNKEIGMQTLRGGDIVGEHTVYYCGDGERIEVKHTATRRTTFARGAIRAAKWLVKQEPGLYNMNQVLGLN
jgi:4-hydroxy-tetrahydrodipicolinate reductase